MPLQLTDADKAGMSPEEIEALTSEGAEAALGNKPADAGDKDGAEPGESQTAQTDEEKAAAAAAAAEGKTGEDGKPAEGEKANAEIDADTLAEIAEGDRSQAPQQFKVEGPKDFKAERTKLRGDMAAIEKKWSDGELSDEEKAQKLGALQDQMDDLLVQHTRAETLREANEQTLANSYSAECKRVAAAAKNSGELDYGEHATAAKQFDSVFQNLLVTQADRPMSELADKAHAAVLAMNGIERKAAAAPAPAPAAQAAAAPAGAPAQPAAKEPPKAPPSLAGMPAAAAAQVGDDTLAQFQRLEGEEAELFLAKLPPAKVEALLRAAG
jgi:hypothetical protein